MKDAKEKLKKAVEALAEKAKDSMDSNDALKFSQAACNAANALRVVIDCEKENK